MLDEHQDACFPTFSGATTARARAAMEYDNDKVDEMVLALLSLTMFKDHSGLRAWKASTGKC